MTEDHRIAIHLPEDFPRGPVEVIFLASTDAERTHPPITPPERATPVETGPAPVLDVFARRFPIDPVLSALVLHEDPTAPLDMEDWPGDARP